MSLGSSLVYAVTRNVRYASMRVHGVSALVEYDPPDLPDRKHVVVERLPQGTRVSSNYSPEVSLHFSIPTPLIVDRVEFDLSAGAASRSKRFRSRTRIRRRIGLGLSGRHRLCQQPRWLNFYYAQDRFN